MASIRKSKKTVSYLIGEVISNSYLAMYFHPEAQGELLEVVSQAVDLHNSVIDKINHPIEKHNPSLVRKHYRAANAELLEGVDGLFEKISTICKK